MEYHLDIKKKEISQEWWPILQSQHFMGCEPGLHILCLTLPPAPGYKNKDEINGIL